MKFQYSIWNFKNKNVKKRKKKKIAKANVSNNTYALASEMLSQGVVIPWAKAHLNHDLYNYVTMHYTTLIAQVGVQTPIPLS